MARVKKEFIRVRHSEDRDFYMDVEIIINVNAQGLFTTTLNEQDANVIESYGVKLYSNGRKKSRKGFFSNSTMDGLIREVKDVLEQCLTRTLISETTVIKYSFHTVASYALTEDDKIIPNLAWGKDGKPDESIGWMYGTEMTHATNPQPVGIQMYVKPFIKRLYKYSNGKEKTHYDELTPFGGSSVEDDKYYLAWLEAICSTKPPSKGDLQEIEYTEDRAKFFVNMFRSICRLASNISKFTSPEDIIDLIDSGTYLIELE